MNKSGKVFLIIFIILAIILIIMTYLYFDALNSLRASLDNSVNNSDILLKTNQAIEDAGFEIQIQEDGSFKLIEEQINAHLNRAKQNSNSNESEDEME